MGKQEALVDVLHFAMETYMVGLCAASMNELRIYDLTALPFIYIIRGRSSDITSYITQCILELNISRPILLYSVSISGRPFL